jgi:ferredoxin
MIELRDSSVADPDTPRELLELWERLVTVESRPMIAGLKGRAIDPMVRVVPIERTVEAQNTVLDIDSARNIFKDAGLITAMPCVCRKIAKANGRGVDCPAPADAVCMQTNFFAAGVMARGLGEKLSREEALRRVGAAEDAGLVHMVRNNVQKDMFMCNCCSCCCTGLYFALNLDYHGAIAPSRFKIRYDSDLCSSCGVCVDRCQFKAISLDGDELLINDDRCMGCGNCALTCPEQALTLVEVRPREHIRIKVK